MSELIQTQHTQDQEPVDANHRLSPGDVALYSTVAAASAVIGAGLGHNAYDAYDQSQHQEPEVAVSVAPDHVANPGENGRISIDPESNTIILPPVEVPGQDVRTQDMDTLPGKDDPVEAPVPGTVQDLDIPRNSLPGEPLAPGVEEIAPPEEVPFEIPPVELPGQDANPGDTIPSLPGRRVG